MTLFPSKRFGDILSFAQSYFDEYTRASSAIDLSSLDRCRAALEKVIAERGSIFSCGNGGSASISNHMVCDHVKGISTDTDKVPKVHSLSSNVEILTAIANDISYDDTYCYQLQRLGSAGDAVITISSSGDSESIVRAIRMAKDMGMVSIAFSGFSGGRSAKEADINVHVPSENYGVIEDIHQSLMHILAQFIRMDGMPDDLLGQRKF